MFLVVAQGADLLKVPLLPNGLFHLCKTVPILRSCFLYDRKDNQDVTRASQPAFVHYFFAVPEDAEQNRNTSSEKAECISNRQAV